MGTAWFTFFKTKHKRYNIFEQKPVWKDNRPRPLGVGRAAPTGGTFGVLSSRGENTALSGNDVCPVLPPLREQPAPKMPGLFCCSQDLPQRTSCGQGLCSGPCWELPGRYPPHPQDSQMNWAVPCLLQDEGPEKSSDLLRVTEHTGGGAGMAPSCLSSGLPTVLSLLGPQWLLRTCLLSPKVWAPQGRAPSAPSSPAGCSPTLWLWMRPSRSSSGAVRFSGVRAQASTCPSICPRFLSSWVIWVRSFWACGAMGRGAGEGPGPTS